MLAGDTLPSRCRLALIEDLIEVGMATGAACELALQITDLQLDLAGVGQRFALLAAEGAAFASDPQYLPTPMLPLAVFVNLSALVRKVKGLHDYGH